MLFQVYKKISVLALIGVCIVVAGAIFAAARLNRNSSLRHLVDYVPNGAEFWLWGAKTVFKTNAADFLKIFSVDEPIISELARRSEEFVIYSKDNRWYKLEAAKKFQNSPHHSDNIFLDQQYREGKNALIGFIGGGYAKEKLSAILGFLPQASYYFTIFEDSSGNVVDFLLIPSEKAGSTIDLFAPLPSPDKSLIFALITNDAALHKGATVLVQEKIREYVAFEHPVTVSRTIPDGSVSKERVADPKLFMWRQDLGGIHTITVDEKERMRLTEPKEIGAVSFPVQYYESSDRLFLGSNAQALQTSVREFGGAKNFMYFSFIDNDGISFVDIMGKSAAFAWLQELNIQSIMMREEDGGILTGRVGYE